MSSFRKAIHHSINEPGDRCIGLVGLEGMRPHAFANNSLTTAAALSAEAA
jgi:hypothetical protein